MSKDYEKKSKGNDLPEAWLINMEASIWGKQEVSVRSFEN